MNERGGPERGEFYGADRLRRRLVAAERVLQSRDGGAGGVETGQRPADGGAHVGRRVVLGEQPGALAAHGVASELMVARQGGFAVGQHIDAQVLHVQRGGADEHADPAHPLLRRGQLAQVRQVALRRDQGVQRVEHQPDRRGEPHALRGRARLFQKQRPRRLQLLGEGGLLADHPPVNAGDIAPRVGQTRVSEEIGRKLA